MFDCPPQRNTSPTATFEIVALVAPSDAVNCTIVDWSAFVASSLGSDTRHAPSVPALAVAVEMVEPGVQQMSQALGAGQGAHDSSMTDTVIFAPGTAPEPHT